MIPDNTCRILWKHSACLPNYEDVDLKEALAMRKELLLLGYEVKIASMIDRQWVTVSETKGWKT